MSKNPTIYPAELHEPSMRMSSRNFFRAVATRSLA